MARETEQTYRVDTNLMPSLEDVPYKEIDQVYFTPWPEDPSYPEVSGVEWRVRRSEKDGQVAWTATLKTGSKQDESRGEVEVTLEEGDFGTNKRDVRDYGQGHVTKIRHVIDGVELDHFLDPEAPHEWLAEKEFDKPEDKAHWPIPDWLSPLNPMPENRQIAVPLTPVLTHPDRMPLDDFIDLLEEHRSPRKPLVISLSGMSASGKGWIAKRIAEHFDGVHIEVDGYQIGRAAINELVGVSNYDLPQVYEHEEVAGHVRRLLNGQEVDVPTYDYVTGERHTDTRHITPPASGVIVVDGLYAKHVNEVLEFDDLTRFDALVATPLYVCVIRRILSEGVAGSDFPQRRTTGMSPEIALRYLHKTAIPTYQEYAHHQNQFDAIV